MYVCMYVYMYVCMYVSQCMLPLRKDPRTICQTILHSSKHICNTRTLTKVNVSLYFGPFLVLVIVKMLIHLLLNFYTYRHIWRINVSESAPTTQQVGPAFVSLINGLAGYSSQQNIHGEMLRNWFLKYISQTKITLIKHPHKLILYNYATLSIGHWHWKKYTFDM